MSVVKSVPKRPSVGHKDLDEARRGMIAAQKRVDQDLREIRKKAPHTHREDHQVVINI
jgi:hypothetical protein